MTVNQRIAALRGAMKAKRLDAYIIPSNDPHQSEYVAEHWKARAWASGFSGSAGTLIVTHEHAGLWTDSRYFLQADMELAGSEVALHKLRQQGAAEFADWLLLNLPEGARVGADGQLFSIALADSLTQQLEARGLSFHSGHDLLAEAWADRPVLPKTPIYQLEAAFAGQSRPDKLAALRDRMADMGADAYLISALDDIAWLFNLRGADVACNPVFYAYALVTRQSAYLFLDEDKLPDAVRSALNADEVRVAQYAEVDELLGALQEGERLLLSPAETNVRLRAAVYPKADIIHGTGIVAQMKAIKSPAEVANIRRTMQKDGVALLRAFRWLEAALAEGPVSEDELAAQLAAQRAQQPHYVGESFDAIVGYQGNGAIVHYHPLPGKSAAIQQGTGTLLVDSGGQYLDGTTDITRTFCLGEPTAEQRLHYTLVLKGHIALAKMVFPHGTRGHQLDTAARQALWAEGLDYGHGTGHGVGYFLNVHEAPQRIGQGKGGAFAVPMEAGMLTSNEPGFYKTGEYGIRIENLLLCVPKMDSDYGRFLSFETLTLYPIALNLVEASRLSAEEKAWLNDYHQSVWEALAPDLDEAERAWLRPQCAPIA